MQRPGGSVPSPLCLSFPGRGLRGLGGGGEGGHLLEIRLLLELGDGLEDEAALAHAQQTGRIGRVGEDPTCEGRQGAGSAFWTLGDPFSTHQNLQGSPEPVVLKYRSTQVPWERAGGGLLSVIPPPPCSWGEGEGALGRRQRPPPPARHPPCREHSLIFPVIQATALAPILVPKFLSKGVGVPPCARKAIG